MDVGLIILGVIVLFGAIVLLKSTGLLENQGGRGDSQRPESQAIKSPTQPLLEFESPATVGRGEFRVCRNCLSENSMNAEFCANCGKKLTRPKDLKVSATQRKWFRQFNWIKNPFTPDVIPSLFTGYKDEVEEILKKLSLRSGNILILGDFGTGKTTLLRWLELNLPETFHPIYVFRPPDKFSELIDVVAYSLDSSRGVKPSEYNIYNIDKLVQRVNKNVVILIDEAHELDLSLNKSLKTLGDVENVNLVLAGLPHLDGKIRKEGPALYDRIVSKVELSNLSEEDTTDLVVKRIENVGGWGHEPFTDDGLDELFNLTYGNPRKIIKLCDCTVTSATTEGVLSIDGDFIHEACERAESIEHGVPEKPIPSGKSTGRKSVKKVRKTKTDLKSVVEERIRKLNKLYGEYEKSGDENGIKEVLDIARTTVDESKKRLKNESLTPAERERLNLMADLFGKWAAKTEKNK